MSTWVWWTLGSYFFVGLVAAGVMWFVHNVLDDEDEEDLSPWEYVGIFFFWLPALIYGWLEGAFLNKRQPSG